MMIDHDDDDDDVISSTSYDIIYFILSSEINVYQKWIKVIFSLQN